MDYVFWVIDKNNDKYIIKTEFAPFTFAKGGIRLLIIKSNLLRIAVINPLKKVGEKDQYVTYSGKETALISKILAARLTRKEIRYYYQDLVTTDGEVIPLKMIITETPPGHVQPFHIHENVHEVTLINKGEMIAIESKTLRESDLEEIKKGGELLKEGDMVIEDPEVRHTHMNASDEYIVTTTIQAARRVPFEKFFADWKR